MTKFGWLVIIFSSVTIIVGGCYVVERVSEYSQALCQFKETVQ